MYGSIGVYTYIYICIDRNVYGSKGIYIYIYIKYIHMDPDIYIYIYIIYIYILYFIQMDPSGYPPTLANGRGERVSGAALFVLVSARTAFWNCLLWL